MQPDPRVRATGPDLHAQQLRVLVALDATGSVTAAARSLGISQPAVTRALSRLEETVGTALVVRHPRGVSLTELGRSLVGHARSFVDEERSARARITRWEADRPREVRLASSAVPMASLVPRAIMLARRMDPSLCVFVRESVYPGVDALFRDGQLDLAIGPTPPARSSLAYRVHPLFRLRLSIAVGSGHAARSVTRIADLMSFPWVIAGSPGGPGDVTADLTGTLGIDPPRIMVRCASVPAAIELIRSGPYVGILPHPLAASARDQGQIELPPITDALPERTIGIFHPETRSLSPSARALLSALRMTGADHAGHDDVSEGA